MVRQESMLKRKIIEFTVGNEINLRDYGLENKKIVRLWTIYDHDKFNPHGIEDLQQLNPVHLDGVFLEERNHDWLVTDNKLFYFSRVVEKERTIQILVEFDE